jgi:APA family basic amino acid/polyamine antiporter
LLGTIGSVALLYFVVQLAFVAFFPTGLQEDENTPLLALGEVVLGPAGALILGLAAVFSLAGNLHANIAATPRLTFAMAERGELPSWLARVHPTYATPITSILFFAVLTAALAISGSFVWLAVVSTLARMIIYAVTILALPRAPQRPARLTRSNWAVGGVGVLICILVAAQADAKAWLTLFGLSAVGFGLYLATAARGRAVRP